MDAAVFDDENFELLTLITLFRCVLSLYIIIVSDFVSLY